MDDPERRPEGAEPLSARELAAFATLLLAVLGVIAALALAI